MSARNGHCYLSHMPKSLVMSLDMFHFWLKSAIIAILQDKLCKFLCTSWDSWLHIYYSRNVSFCQTCICYVSHTSLKHCN